MLRMKTTLFGFLVAACCASLPALADDCAHAARPVPQYAPQQQYVQGGHYELQQEQQWLPPTSTQLWVPGTCDATRGWGRRHHREVCTSGGYRTIWHPGRYVTTQRWVWVADAAPVYREHHEHRRVAYQEPAYPGAVYNSL